MKKKKVALKSLKLDKSHLLNLNAEDQVQGGINSIVKGPVKTLFPTTTDPNDPTKATFCFFCPPDLSLDAFCI